MARVLAGTVVSTKRNKTITVRVDRDVSHPVYKKAYTTSKKFHVHDEENKAKEGDKVSFSDSRPISKTKKWRLLEITETGSIK